MITIVFRDDGRFDSRSLDPEQPSTEGQLRRPAAVGQPSVTADMLEAVGQDMQQEATDELISRECHRLAHGFLSVVLPAEHDVVAVEAHQAVIGDRDPMRVAAQIVEHLPRAAEGRFRVDDPVGLRGGCEPCGEGFGVSERRELAVETQCIGVKGAAKLFEEQTPEQPREHSNGQEEAGTTGDPAFVAQSNAATRYDTVYVGMMLQVLPPCMQDRDEADVCSQVFGIGGDRAQRVGTGSKQDVIERLLVLVGERRDRLGESKDDMEVFNFGK